MPFKISTTYSLIIVWLTSVIDNKGIGNGTSIIIFTNIVQTLVGKNVFNSVNLSLSSGVEILVLGLLLALISISQTARFNIEIVFAEFGDMGIAYKIAFFIFNTLYACYLALRCFDFLWSPLAITKAKS